MVSHCRNVGNLQGKEGALSYGAIRPPLKPDQNCTPYSQYSLNRKLIENTPSVLTANFFQKDKIMKNHIKSISLGALMALAMASASAQAPMPATGASSAATVGVTPQEASTALKQAVPRSDTATVVRTAPSPAQRASDAMGSNNTAAPAATTSNTASTAPMTGTARNGTMGTTRAARADRN